MLQTKSESPKSWGKKTLPAKRTVCFLLNHKKLLCLCLHFKSVHNVHHYFSFAPYELNVWLWLCLQKDLQYQKVPPPPSAAFFKSTVILAPLNGKFHGNHPINYFRISSGELHGNLPHYTTEQHSNQANVC